MSSIVPIVENDRLRGVGQRLRDLRLAAGETQTQTANSLGLSRQYVSAAELGANITLDIVYRFADHFKVPASSLLDSK